MHVSSSGRTVLLLEKAVESEQVLLGYYRPDYHWEVKLRLLVERARHFLRMGLPGQEGGQVQWVVTLEVMVVVGQKRLGEEKTTERKTSAVEIQVGGLIPFRKTRLCLQTPETSGKHGGFSMNQLSQL